MAKNPQYPPKRVTFQVSTKQRPDFKHPLAAYVFDARGELIQRADVRDGKVELTLPNGELGPSAWMSWLRPPTATARSPAVTPRTMLRSH